MYRSETSIAKLWRQSREIFQKEQWSKIVRESVTLKEEKVLVIRGKEKGQCSEGDQCSFQHKSNDRAQKLDHDTATLSEPSLSRDQSVSKKRSIQDQSKPWFHSPTTVQISFEGYLQAIALANIGILLSVNFTKNEAGCKAGGKCLFPYHDVDEQPNLKPKQRLLSTQKRKRRQECSGS